MRQRWMQCWFPQYPCKFRSCCSNQIWDAQLWFNCTTAKLRKNHSSSSIKKKNTPNWVWLSRRCGQWYKCACAFYSDFFSFLLNVIILWRCIENRSTNRSNNFPNLQMFIIDCITAFWLVSGIWWLVHVCNITIIAITAISNDTHHSLHLIWTIVCVLYG